MYEYDYAIYVFRIKEVERKRKCQTIKNNKF